MRRSRAVSTVKPLLALALAAAVGAAFPAQASETVQYEYDVLGRLVKTSVTGGQASGANTDIAYDPAGNRTQYKVAGARAAPPPATRLIIVPIRGFKMIRPKP